MSGRRRGSRTRRISLRTAALAYIAAVLVAAFAVVGSYAAIKGEISEKLAFRLGASLGPHNPIARRTSHQVARGLDDPRWDFSPKEESDHIPIRNWQYAVIRIADKWWEALCWLFAVMTVWGMVRQRFVRSLCADRDPDDSARIARFVLVTSILTLLAILSGMPGSSPVLAQNPEPPAPTGPVAPPPPGSTR